MLIRIACVVVPALWAFLHLADLALSVAVR